MMDTDSINSNYLNQDGNFPESPSRTSTSTASTPKNKNKNKSDNVKLFRIRLLGHCIFCLRKTTTKDMEETLERNINTMEFLEKVPKVESSVLMSTNLLATFNRIWPYLQILNGEQTEEDNRSFLGSTAGGQDQGRKENKCVTAFKFNRLPNMCQFCAEKLEAIDKLWRELSTHITGLSCTIKDSKYGGLYSWRAENFEKELRNSSLEDESVLEVLEFLEIVDSPSVATDIPTCDEAAKIETDTDPGPQQEEESEYYSCFESPFPASEIGISLTSSSPKTVHQQPTIVVDQVPITPTPRRLSRQTSFEVLPKCQPRVPVCQQSSASDIFTSHETEMSFEKGEAEEADDEDEPDYARLEYEGLSSSDFDSSDDDEPTAAASSSEEEPESVIAYQNLVNNYGLRKSKKLLTGSSNDLTKTG